MGKTNFEQQLDAAFEQAANDTGSSTRTSVVRPLVLNLFEEELRRGQRLKNDTIADLVVQQAAADGNEVKTTSKTVATYRTREKATVLKIKERLISEGVLDAEGKPVEEVAATEA